MWYKFFKILLGIPSNNEPYVPMRPKCGHCKGPLDFFPDPDTGRYGWCCNNLENKHTPAMNDEEFKRRWKQLPGDDVVKLLREKTL